MCPCTELDMAQPPEARRATTYFAGAIGGASEMTLIAERHGARTDLVASAHSLRVLMVTAHHCPLPCKLWGVHGMDASASHGGRAKCIAPRAWLVLFMLSPARCLALMVRLGRANPWFMGALLVTMVLTLADVQSVGIARAADQCGPVGHRHQPGRALFA
jgi:uncharacterized membrane protein AbrB (regulator of aidB expression)